MPDVGLLGVVEGRAARLLATLPPQLQRKLAGGAPVVRDGLTLDPSLQLVLALRKRLGAPHVNELTPANARARIRRDALVHAGPTIEVGAVRELDIPTSWGAMRARHYAPLAADRAPLLLFLHGGGFVVGDLDTHDSACRILCRTARVHVVAVAYRLAPEHPFPAAVDDALEAFRWAQANASALGADPARVGVAGDSAGGNLASNVARLAKPGPALQLLLYPTVDRTRPHRSLELFADGFFLTAEEIAWYQHQYAAGVDLREPRISPLLATDLGGLAPALVVTAGFDPLRDEGEAYAHALRDARTHAVLRRFDDLIHGFINMTAVSRACADALVEVSGAARAMLDAVR